MSNTFFKLFETFNFITISTKTAFYLLTHQRIPLCTPVQTVLLVRMHPSEGGTTNCRCQLPLRPIRTHDLCLRSCTMDIHIQPHWHHWQCTLQMDYRIRNPYKVLLIKIHTFQWCTYAHWRKGVEPNIYSSNNVLTMRIHLWFME